MIREGNPPLGNKMQLFCRKGNNCLAIYADGTIKGTEDRNDPHTHLQIISARSPGHVKIQGTLARLFVTMNNDGKLQGQPDAEVEGAIFLERFQGSYNTYLSLKHANLDWYIGIKKNGKVKRGPKTKYGQEAVQFLPNRTLFE